MAQHSYYDDIESILQRLAFADLKDIYKNIFGFVGYLEIEMIESKLYVHDETDLALTNLIIIDQ